MTVLEAINNFFTPLQFYTLIWCAGIAAFGLTVLAKKKNPPQEHKENLEQSS